MDRIGIQDMACAILAGGLSRRMGQDKALLDYKGKNFVEHICEELDFFKEKYIARGENPEFTIPGWKSIEDQYPGQGPMAGIQAVLAECKAKALFVVTCDMPLFSGRLIPRFLDALKEGVDAVITVTEDGRIHPLCGIYPTSLEPLFRQQLESHNLRMMEVLKDLSVAYVVLDATDSPCLQNINTKEDYLGIQ